MSKRRSKKKNAYALLVLTLAVIVSLYKLSHTQASDALHTKIDDKADVSAVPNVPDEELVCPRYTTNAPPEQMLKRFAYTTSYNKHTRTPNWVGWVLTADHTDGTHVRRGQMFREDTDVPRPRAAYDDIRESECGYQRGHICPAGDNKWSNRAQTEAFLMTNICPQNGDLNQRDWKYLEEACRDWAKRYGRVYIVAGPIFTSKSPQTVGEHHVAVPDAFFKVVLALPASSSARPQALGFVYANKAGHRDMEYYVHSVDEVERMTGLDFFYQLEDGMEEEVEAKSEIGKW